MLGKNIEVGAIGDLLLLLTNTIGTAVEPELNRNGFILLYYSISRLEFCEKTNEKVKIMTRSTLSFLEIIFFFSHALYFLFTRGIENERRISIVEGSL